MPEDPPELPRTSLICIDCQAPTPGYETRHGDRLPICKKCIQHRTRHRKPSRKASKRSKRRSKT